MMFSAFVLAADISSVVGVWKNLRMKFIEMGEEEEADEWLVAEE